MLLAGLAGQAGGTTGYVDANGSRDFTTIQGAINDPCIVDGDEIEVTPGTYPEAIIFNGKAVRLYSKDGPEVTTIDGTGYYHVVLCVSGEDGNTILEGFTITGGNANGTFPDNCGGGMYNNVSTPTVSNCIFSGNTASYRGGGMYNYNSSPAIWNCTFSGNTASDRGGGMYNHNYSGPTVDNCTFSGNSAGDGGGMYNYFFSSPTVTDCDFSGNFADEGGGMHNYNYSNPTVTDCNFYNNNASDSGGGIFNNMSSPAVTDSILWTNSANYGGGMCNLQSSDPNLVNCIFNGNTAVINGGGVCNASSSPTVTNCTFGDNSANGVGLAQGGGGMYNYNDSNPTVTNCTFNDNNATNYGGGIMNNLNNEPILYNCILWGDSPDEIYDYGFPDSNTTVNYSDVEGGWPGSGNIDAYPFFVDAAGGDLRLGTFSPCVDAGNNAAVPPGVTTDLAGNPRFVDDAGIVDTGAGTAPIVDMGAYERQVESVENERSQTRLDHFWRFKKGDTADANQAGFDDSGWRIVSVPHDWTIEDLTPENGPFNASAIGHHDTGYTLGGTAWYRKTFSLDANDSNKIVHLQFDGVYMNSDVWVNGTHVGNRPYGYSTFWFDITDDVIFGAENVIAVEVKNEGKNSRWYSGSGIFRPVRLMIMEPVHVEHWGPYITTPVVSTSSADVKVRTEVKNESDANETVTLQSTILDSNGVTVATDSVIFSIPGANSYDFNQTIAVSNPNLWSIDSPMLYTLSQHVHVSGQIVDQIQTTFGIRSILFDAANGFLLNGENVLLQGGCMHHDNYMLGSANTIRTSHNPPSQAFLQACDRLGVLVIDESFDMWNYPKSYHFEDYSKYFASWWQADIDSMVLRDRNHASIIMWSIGNEIPEQWDEVEGPNTSDMLATYVRSLDLTRPVTLAANCSGEYYDDYLDTLDVVGYNYQLGSYTSEHSRVSDRVMYGSESYPKEAFDYWKAVEDYNYVIGDFVWTSFDYLGETGIGWTGFGPPGSAPYPWHLAYCGDIDACGYKRPAAYYRDVLWKTGQNKVSAFVESPTPSLPDYYPTDWWHAWVYPDIHPSWTWPGY
jgi:beta-galactosidase